MSFPILLFPSQDLFVFNIHEEPKAGRRCRYVTSLHKVIQTQCEEVYMLRKQKWSMWGGRLKEWFRDSKSLLS